MPYQIIYSSQAARPMTPADLEEILVDARAGNEARNITGALIYVDTVFLQIIEGDKETVLDLMSHIAADSRHSAVKIFSETEASEAMFGSWSMAYVDATPEQMSAWASLPATASIDSILGDLDHDPSRASKIFGGILKALAG